MGRDKPTGYKSLTIYEFGRPLLGYEKRKSALWKLQARSLELNYFVRVICDVTLWVQCLEALLPVQYAIQRQQ